MSLPYLTLLSAPEVEPVTLQEALVQCHADSGVEDAWFTAKISSGRRKVEDYIKRSLITQTWAFGHDCNAPAIINLPRSPVQEVLEVKIDGEVIDLASFTSNIEAIPARLILPSSGGSLRIVYKAGYGDTGEFVPETLRDAILLYVSYSYENRAGEGEVPKAFYDLISSFRLHTWEAM